ncbi:hypothetical protein RJ639_033537 [Escallonia herrerae]|uniref:Mitochondrial adenine nucleotide transporter BTL3 n=1 Tax=Escallonia herrerae TaxID=1293975 RepID=A0AA89BEQ4_9ASTE|nr:hypothetical protein RJ639_033537 [Escallonia herrerae]
MPQSNASFNGALQSHARISFDSNWNSNSIIFSGGLFLDSAVPSSIFDFISFKSPSVTASNRLHCSARGFRRKKQAPAAVCGGFLSLSLSSDGVAGQSSECSEKKEVVARGGSGPVNVEGKKQRDRVPGRGAINTTKHLWAGAVAAMVSRSVILFLLLCMSWSFPMVERKPRGSINDVLPTCVISMLFCRTFVAPLERLKLEYIVRGEQKNLFDLVKTIAATQGFRGFWKGNLVNILRTAPFKAINFCAYDTYRKQLLKFSGNEETTNSERFVAGAAAGVTASVLCLPLDTIRTKLVAHGGEALGGVIGAFRHVIQTEGFFSLYKGLVPSVMSMAPAGAVFYGVYDILKTAYLRSPDGRQRMLNMKQQDHELNVLEQLELGPVRTLLHGAIAGACAEAATYPFEVVRRQLQLQVRATKLSALATCIKIVEQGGIPALYAGLIPSLLQVLCIPNGFG